MASIEYVVNATDAASAVFAKIALSADGLDKQLEDLGKRVADPEVKLDDAKFTVGMIRAAERLDKLSAMVADPKVEVDTAKAQLEILRINAMLDRLDAKRVSVSVDVDRSMFSRLGGGLGGLFGGIGGAGAAAGGGVSALGGYGQAALFGGLGILGAALAPALLPLGLGGLAGLGGAGGALAIGAKGAPLLLADRQALARAQASLAGTKGPGSASQLLTLRLAQQKLARDQALYGGFMPLQQAFTGLGRTAFGTFAGALSARGPGFGAGPHYVPGAPSFLTSLQGILEQIGRFIKTLGPGLGDLFRASVPYLKLFVHFLEQAAKTLLPVFTNMLKQMQPFLPLIAKGLMIIVSGLAGFIKAIGPSGMQASAKAFIVLARIIAGVMVGLGHALNWIAEHMPTWVHNVAAWFDRWRHNVAATGDAVMHYWEQWRHWWANFWDVLFQNTIGRVRRGWNDITHEFDIWRHNTAVWFDRVRHDIAAVWDLTWNNTVGRAQRGIDDVVHWLGTLPGRALHALFGFGHSLYAFARSALSEMWSGFKSVGGSILGWFKNFLGGIPHAILSFLHMSPPHAGSVFYDLGANIMHHVEAGMQSRARHVANAARSAFSGASYAARTGSVAVEQRYAASLLSSYGWPGGEMGPLVALWNRESGWNPYAVNPSSGAYGIPQSLGHGHPFNLGDYKAQIIWGLNYIRSVYGSPGAAWAHELRMGWYDSGGWLPPGLSMALNTTGRPERVGGGNTYINVTVQVGHGTSPRQAAKEIADILNQGAMSGIKLRNSILSTSG